MVRYRISQLLPVLLLLVLVGCAGRELSDLEWRDPSIDIVWPVSPEQPRIRLLRILSGPGDFRERDKAGRLFRWIAGGQSPGLPLAAPYGVAADGRGKIWVADAGSSVVHVFDLARKKVDYLTSAGSERLISPVGLAYDAERDRLYVADTVIKKVFAFSGDGNFLRVAEVPGGFGRPTGLVVGADGHLYVTDVLQGVIHILSPQGEPLGEVGEGAVGIGGLNRPVNVCVDGKGRIFVVDSMNFRVVVFGPDGKLLSSFGQIGDVPGSFARPRGVAVDSEGHVYVADAAFDNIQVFDAAGRLLLYFGSAGKKPGQFSLPAGLFIDQSDRLYVTDAFNGRIQIFEYLPERR